MVDSHNYAVILDRDETINADPGYLNDSNKVVLLPQAAAGIRLLNYFHIPVFVATNQSGVARGLITATQLAAVHERITELLAVEGAHIEKFYVCPHRDEDNCACRKPKSGLIDQIVQENKLDPQKIFIMGDRARDLESGKALNLKGILIGNSEKVESGNMVLRADNLHVAASFVLETIFEAASQSKVFATCENFLPQLNKLRAANQRIIFTNGCFDILHSGHVQLLAQARALGDFLILGLNADSSVRKLKGSARPINSQFDRARILAQLPYVDAIIVFAEDTPVELLQQLQPDVHVKGGDYDLEKLPEYTIMRALNKEIIILPFRKGYSTTGILAKSIS